MLQPSSNQKLILFSKEIGALPAYHSSKRLMPVIEDDVVYPRVFPSTKIPLKVALSRRAKLYLEFNLDSALKEVSWNQGKSLMDLKYFNF